MVRTDSQTGKWLIPLTHPTTGAMTEVVAEAPRVVPPAVYVPIRADGHTLASEIPLGPEHGYGLVVYTALDRLLDNCGREQSWSLRLLASLEEVRIERAIDVILFDVTFPEAYRAGGQLP